MIIINVMVYLSFGMNSNASLNLVSPEGPQLHFIPNILLKKKKFRCHGVGTGSDSQGLLISRIRDLKILGPREQTLSSVPQHAPCDLAGTGLRFPMST